MGASPTSETAPANVEETTPAGGEPEPAYQNAIGAYQSFVVPNEAAEETETKPEGEPKGEEPPSGEQRTETAEGDGGAKPEGEQSPNLSELTDEQLEELVRNERVQSRIEQLANNRLGNRLQQEREKARREVQQEAEQWEQATNYYNRLQQDDDFYEQQVQAHGEEAILDFRANYMRAAKQRNGAAPVDVEAVRAEYREQFNQGAIPEFQEALKQLTPFYDELPEDSRKAIEGLAYNPEGNWLADGFEAYAKGVSKYIEGLERKHKEALDEAREAGRNEARAAREEGKAVVVNNGQPGDFDPHQVIREYGLMQGDWSREDFHRAKKMLGEHF